MNYLKRVGIVLAGLIFVAIVLNNFYVDLIDPHRWDRPVLEEVQRRGFDLVHKRTLSNPIFPWTFFYPCTVHLTFADPRSIKEYRGFISAQTVVYNRDDRGKVDTASYIELFDCESKLFTIVFDGEKRYDDRVFRADEKMVERNEWRYGPVLLQKMNSAGHKCRCGHVFTA